MSSISPVERVLWKQEKALQGILLWPWILFLRPKPANEYVAQKAELIALTCARQVNVLMYA